jgi:hypothetical protein
MSGLKGGQKEAAQEMLVQDMSDSSTGGEFSGCSEEADTQKQKEGKWLPGAREGNGEEIQNTSGYGVLFFWVLKMF